MASITSSRPRVKPQRHATLGNPCNGVRALCLTVGKDRFGYYITALETSWGLAFRLVKFAHQVEEGEPDHYDVNLDGARSTCECRGYLRHRHCKHIESLLALQAEGRLPPSPAPFPSWTPDVELDIL
jgi:hypothetical protein